jgi:hypothetical protein
MRFAYLQTVKDSECSYVATTLWKLLLLLLLLLLHAHASEAQLQISLRFVIAARKGRNAVGRSRQRST